MPEYVHGFLGFLVDQPSVELDPLSAGFLLRLPCLPLLISAPYALLCVLQMGASSEIGKSAA